MDLSSVLQTVSLNLPVFLSCCQSIIFVTVCRNSLLKNENNAPNQFFGNYKGFASAGRMPPEKAITYHY